MKAALAALAAAFIAAFLFAAFGGLFAAYGGNGINPLFAALAALFAALGGYLCASKLEELEAEEALIAANKFYRAWPPR